MRLIPILLLFPTLLLTQTGWGEEKCTIEMSPFNIVIKEEGYRELFQPQNCSAEQERLALTTLQKKEGLVRAEEIASESTLHWSLPQWEVYRLESYLKDKLEIKDPYQILKAQFIGTLSHIKLYPGERLELGSQSGPTVGERTIQLQLSGVKGEASYWTTVEIGQKILALKAKTNLSPLSENLLTSFALEEIVTKTPEFLFSDLPSLRFYRLNKNVAQGESLKVSDLVAHNLVMMGQKVNVTLQNRNLNIRTTAFARNGGKLHDYITLEKSRGGTSFTGKIVDFNTVKVEI